MDKVRGPNSKLITNGPKARHKNKKTINKDNMTKKKQKQHLKYKNNQIRNND